MRLRMLISTFVRPAAAFAAVVIALAPAASLGGSSGNFAPMRFMLGAWTCSGKALDGSGFSLTQTTTMSGDRMVTRDSEGKSTTAIFWDSAKQQWVQTSESGQGSSTQTSSGWTGTSLIFTGTITIAGSPGAVGYRSTTVKVNDAETQQLDELAKPDGSWLTFDTAICTKKTS